VIGAADDQRGAGAKAGLLGDIDAEPADLCPRTPNGRQYVRVDYGGVQHDGGSIAVDSEKPRLQGPVLLGMHIGAKRHQHPVV